MRWYILYENKKYFGFYTCNQSWGNYKVIGIKNYFRRVIEILDKSQNLIQLHQFKKYSYSPTLFITY